MSYNDGNFTGMYMPVAPAGGNGYGFGDGGAMWWMMIVFFWLIAGGNGFGNFGGNNGYGTIQRGFDQQSVMSGINSVSSNIASLSNQLCNTGAGITQSIYTGFSGAEAAANARQIANMQMAYAAQTDASNNARDIMSQLASCCCENRLATANLGAVIAQENCADRTAISNAARDIVTHQDAGIQRILDQLCSDKIDAKNERIATLERQLTMAQLAANGSANTAAIIANNEAQTVALEQYLNPPAKPAYIVPNPCCGAYPGYSYVG